MDDIIMRVYKSLTIEEGIKLGKITQYYDYLTADELQSKLEFAHIGDILTMKNDHPFSYKHVEGYIYGIDVELVKKEAIKTLNELYDER